MSRHVGDDAWSQPPEEERDLSNEPRDTIETPPVCVECHDEAAAADIAAERAHFFMTVNPFEGIR